MGNISRPLISLSGYYVASRFSSNSLASGQWTIYLLRASGYCYGAVCGPVILLTLHGVCLYFHR